LEYSGGKRRKWKEVKAGQARTKARQGKGSERSKKTREAREAREASDKRGKRAENREDVPFFSPSFNTIRRLLKRPIRKK
jgi:hypothetical protein